MDYDWLIETRFPSLLDGCRVLVTGASGFIGTNLVRALTACGATVHALIRSAHHAWRLSGIAPPPRRHLGDLRDLAALRAIFQAVKPQIVFHLATVRPDGCTEDRAEFINGNILAADNLIGLCLNSPVDKIIVTGSSLEYGHRLAPLHEQLAPMPVTLHGATKAAATLLWQQAALAEQLPAITLRLFSVYGYWEPARRLIPTAIRAALSGTELPLTGAGFRRDWVFVEDVIQACLSAVGSTGITGEIINIGSGHQHGNEEVTQLIAALLDKPLKTRIGDYLPHPTDTGFWCADRAKAQRLLDWSATHSLIAGLTKTIAWYRRNPAALIHP